MGDGGRHWSAFSPLLYRQLLNGFYAGVKAVEPGDTVIAAGIAPEGEPAGVGVMAPVTFLEVCSVSVWATQAVVKSLTWTYSPSIHCPCSTQMFQLLFA